MSQFVKFGEKKYKIKEKKGLITLEIRNTLLSSIKQIESLDSVNDLEVLNLPNNEIDKIEGLDHLSKLKKLNLSRNSISKIEGLDNLTELEELRINCSKINELEGLRNLIKLSSLILPNKGELFKWLKKSSFEYTNTTAGARVEDPQACVKFCQEKHLKYLKSREPIIEKTKNFIIAASDLYETINFNIIKEKTGIFVNELQNLIEDMILNNEINARISGTSINYKEPVLIAPPQTTISTPSSSYLQVLRGGDWKVENDQSVFYYKVKVKNNSSFVITNLQIILTSIPSGLIVQSDSYRIDIMNPNSFESPTFKLFANDSCVGDEIKGIVIYTDPKGNSHTIPIRPFELKYVCNLLVPKHISEENYEKNTATMHEKKIMFDCDLDLEKLESEITKILQNNNFYLLRSQRSTEMSDFKKLNAYAEGKYDKQDVALSIMMQEIINKANKLIIKAMSHREEKLMDILRDISYKCNNLKSSSETSTLIEIVCENCQNRIKLTEDLKLNDIVICENCGMDIEL